MSPKYVQITKKQRRQYVRRLAAFGTKTSSESKMVLRYGPKRQCKKTPGRRIRRPVSWVQQRPPKMVQKVIVKIVWSTYMAIDIFSGDYCLANS